ncbi:hypothetical protein RclHR1_29510001, partial [Rhizophagus clarus]
MNIDPTDFYPSHDPTATTATNTTTTTTPTTTNTIDQEMIKEVQVINKDRTLDTKNNIQRNRHPENDGNVGGLVGKRKLQIVQKEENNLTLKTKKRIKKGKNNKQIKIQKDHYKKDSDMKQDNDNKQYNFKKYNMNLKIGCINIRGLNDSNNQLNLRRIITNEKWDIAIVTKTKLNNQKGQHIFKDWESYDCLNCSYNKFEQKKGIMIIIRKELSQRKVNIERINDKEKTNKIKRKIIDWVEEAEKLNQELIILDDFNKADKATNRMNRLITKCFNNLTLHDINRCLAGDEVLDTWMNKIKKQKNWIKLDTEDWETIAATVEEQIMKEDTQLTINWNTIVGIYQNTHQEIIEKKKLNIEEENKAMENCLNEEILYKNPQLYIKNMIIERDRFLYLEYIGHHIEKFLNKLLDKLYNKHYRETAKNFQLAKRTYIAISTFPNWNEDNMIKKKNKLKIESLVKLYNNKEIIEDKKLDIDKLRDLMFRKSFKENIGKIEQTCNEMTKDIINMNIDINIRTRETYLENDIGKMINRILERKKEKIDMSNLFIRENRIFTIETDKQKIKERVHNHYKEWMKKRNIDLDLIEFNKEWRNNYQPITEINEQIYDSILEDITIEELDNIIKETKSGKAAARKIFLKVLVKRLAKILSSNKILQGFNYAALLNESTLEPPKIVQSIVKDANKEKKEVWILLMDISKAFDSVSMIMLEKSLKRIKIPESLIEIIMDINLNRTNKVIVNSEFTKEYKVEDGVDQDLLKKEKISIYKYEYNDRFIHHCIKGGKTEIIEFLTENKIEKSSLSRKKKGVIFIEQILEENQEKILKWKHFCKINDLSTKGKIPFWFTKIKNEITIMNTRKLKEKYLNWQYNNNELKLKTYDEILNLERKVIITWNDSEGETIFSENKKKSRSKKYKRIGIHLIPNSTLINDEDNSLTLIVCTGCNKNIKRINDGICHIYIENENSRIINNRKEDNKLKPYKSFGDIKNRNEKLIKDKILKKRLIIEEEEESNIDNINFNKRIDQIDQTIEASENFIEEIKNNILKNTKEIYDVFIQVNKGKMKLQKKKKIITYISSIMITSYYDKDIIYWRKNFRLDSEDDNKMKKWLQIKWAYRRWSKIISQAKWKHELLHCKLVEVLFINNYKDEFDWETSLEFISNRNQCRKM